MTAWPARRLRAFTLAGRPGKIEETAAWSPSAAARGAPSRWTTPTRSRSSGCSPASPENSRGASTSWSTTFAAATNCLPGDPRCGNRTWTTGNGCWNAPCGPTSSRLGMGCRSGSRTVAAASSRSRTASTTSIAAPRSPSHRGCCARKPCWSSTASPRHAGGTRSPTGPTGPFSASPLYAGRAVVAMATDPAVRRRAGCVWSTWDLSDEYPFTDADGTRPHWARKEALIRPRRADLPLAPRRRLRV